jgi:protein-disulfide isomerase
VLEKLDLLEADYIDTGQVRYIVHPYHLGRPEMALATEAAWCAQDQGQFFEYQHVLFENQGQIDYTQSSLANLAATVGLDQNSFAECLSSGQHQADVANARQAALRQEVNSTPTFFINNRRVVGNQPYPEFQQIIDQAIAAAP